MKKIVILIMFILMINSVMAIEGIDAKNKIKTGVFGLPQATIGQEYKITTEITAQESGIARCEVGIYKESEVREWHPNLFSLIGVNENTAYNCISREKNVATKEIRMDAEETITAIFEVLIPPDFDPDIRYSAHAVCFNYCYNENPDAFDFSIWNKATVASVDVVGEQQVKLPHCQDSYKNADETGHNCGGEDCNKCEIGVFCKEDTDCVSDFCDASQGYTCRQPTQGDNDNNDDQTDYSVLLYGAIILIIIIFFILILTSAKN